jgi:hypothetical protein
VGVKQKRCQSCKLDFEPLRPMQIACSIACSVKLAAEKRQRKAAQEAREERRSRREALDKVKTRGEHLRESQAAFNAWIRLRDADDPCISCRRPASWGGQWDAGHYLSRGSSPALRFEPLNVHKQCLPCNRHHSGFLVAYRINLIEKIGQDKVEWIEGPHEPKKLTIPEIVELKAFYRAEVRRLKKERE